MASGNQVKKTMCYFIKFNFVFSGLCLCIPSDARQAVLGQHPVCRATRWIDLKFPAFVIRDLGVMVLAIWVLVSMVALFFTWIVATTTTCTVVTILYLYKYILNGGECTVCHFDELINFQVRWILNCIHLLYYHLQPIVCGFVCWDITTHQYLHDVSNTKSCCLCILFLLVLFWILAHNEYKKCCKGLSYWWFWLELAVNSFLLSSGSGCCFCEGQAKSSLCCNSSFCQLFFILVISCKFCCRVFHSIQRCIHQVRQFWDINVVKCCSNQM